MPQQQSAVLVSKRQQTEPARALRDYVVIAAEPFPRDGATTVVNDASILAVDGVVYNLTVEDTPEYYANGILVHNCDEPGAWKYATDAWDMMMFGLRLGDNPRVVATTTPRPIQLIRDLVKLPGTVITRGRTADNAANLAPQFLEQIVGKYAGTRLGRQELEGEILDDVPGALWARAQLDALRVDVAPELIRVVTAIDPAMTSGEKADETGLVTAGKGVDGDWYVLADKSCRDTPDGWGRRAVGMHQEFSGDRIIAEVNNGGEMVEHVLRTIDVTIPYKAVHASRGKRVRAEPIAALYEQGKVHHVGLFPQLEDQMCAFVPDDYAGSPDRVDAMVWALTELSEQQHTWQWA
jgi:phage terminase large subunit-like protein